MHVNILQLAEGAREARGTAIIIDVLRAFSTACYAINKGIETIIPVGDINLAYQLKKDNPDYLLTGERHERKPEGFDFGNSPTHINDAAITAKTMVQTTSSGTQGITSAINADEIITGSFVNAGAIINYIQNINPEEVSLVCMGFACQYPTAEDTLCAEYIKNELEGQPNDFAAMVQKIKETDGARFFDPATESWSPESDFHLCMDLNRFDFILKVEKVGDLNYLRKLKI
ncbi:2-phosphosulfolactate phosphatase [uncultured Draconibacterium sp.]|uniref:2-phosphosulfolactate phosphatase n=1 Tax=uncultured Draconibacterium sp. TaxID=1573823 RepID=UPI0029C7EC08|nr:2-phosphosulfolactate phosphatase [uncultured Draconibacterium sp.]